MKKTDLAKAITAYCFRNTSLENIHAGAVPVSNAGDFSDVFIIDANGRKIPWNKVSRISQAEMKELMQTAVNRVYAVLTHDGDTEFEERVLSYALTFTRGWDEPGEGLFSSPPKGYAGACLGASMKTSLLKIIVSERYC